MQRILISSCLLGQRVRYDGGHCAQASPYLKQWQEEGRLIAICPEMAGGLPAPRPPAEIEGGQADRVWSGQAPIRTNQGEDVTAAFLKGAGLALELAKAHHIRLAILKEKSPSCGVNQVYDGRFQGQLVRGMGVTATTLTQSGIRVFSEFEIEAAHAFLQTLEKV